VLAQRAVAQNPPGARIHRIGFIGGVGPTSPEAGDLFRAFFDGMRERGYVEGRNYVFEGRYYGFQPERIPALVDELVALKVDVIVAGSSPAPETAHRITSTIPIVLTMHADPVASGLAQSLARPGKNVTGRASIILSGKRLQVLKQALPTLSRVAVLVDPVFPLAATEVAAIEAAAHAEGVEVKRYEVRSPDDFARAFAGIAKDRAGALTIIGGNTFYSERTRFLGHVTQSRLPSIFAIRQYVDGGGLMSYGADIEDTWRGAATYVDLILKGAKPAELAIQQADKFAFVVNLRTAKALGITIPPSLLQLATDVVR
jgi:putative ABC transport system substrate-binding protein